MSTVELDPSQREPILDLVLADMETLLEDDPGDALYGVKQGQVVAVGSGRVLDSGEQKALEVKKGDRVLFGAYAGSEVKVDGHEYLIMAESEILAIVENGKK